MTDADARLAEVARLLGDLRRPFVRNGYTVPPALETAWRISKGLQGSNVASDVELLNARCMTFATAAEVLAVSPSTVKRLVRSGKLPTVDVFGCPRIRVADIDTYMATRPIRRVAS